MGSLALSPPCCCKDCLRKIFPDGPPASVQAELSGNTYSSLFAPSQTEYCCPTWTSQLLGRDDLFPGFALTPSCFSEDFTEEQFNAAYTNSCVLSYYWQDHTCKNAAFPLQRAAYREFAAWFVAHPTTGNIWAWALARIYDLLAGTAEWETIVQGYLDTTLSSLSSGGSGPFTVPMVSGCTTTYNGSFARNGCWNTALGDIIITP